MAHRSVVPSTVNNDGSCSIQCFRTDLCPFVGLAVDYFNERLYWADAKLSIIGSVRLDGSDPVIAISGLKNS